MLGCVVPKDDMPNPGRKYPSTTKTAFFPMSTEGVQLVDRLQDAFSARLLFTVKSAADGSGDELVWNGVCHKTNVFGGPQQYVDSLLTAFVLYLYCVLYISPQQPPRVLSAFRLRRIFVETYYRQGRCRQYFRKKEATIKARKF